MILAATILSKMTIKCHRCCCSPKGVARTTWLEAEWSKMHPNGSTRDWIKVPGLGRCWSAYPVIISASCDTVVNIVVVDGGLSFFVVVLDSEANCSWHAHDGWMQSACAGHRRLSMSPIL